MVRSWLKTRGYVLLLAIVALFVLLVLGVGSLSIAVQSYGRARNNQRFAVSINLAEAGADAAEAWLRAQSAPPSGTGEIDPLNGTKTLSVGTYSARIYPDATNPGAWRKKYTIVGTGTAKGTSQSREVIVKVQEQSFALYSYFTDQETSPVTSGTIWFFARDRLYGPVHSNDQFHVSWSRTSADPIFYGTVSSAADSVDWYNNQVPTSTQDWRRILAGGQDALTLGVDEIELPTGSTIQRDAAWGASSGFPGTNGVYVPTAGSQMTAGIYVRGDSRIEFTLPQPQDGISYGQVVTIRQGSGSTGTWTEVKTDLQTNQTTVVTWRNYNNPQQLSSNTYTGLPNGVIYSTGNITSLEGMIANNYENGNEIVTRNAWTIATDVGTNKDMTITDHLEYQTQPDSTKPATHPSNLRAPCLGLVSNIIRVADGCPNDMRINAVLLADAYFYYEGWDSNKQNNLRILGGIIQRQRGPVSTFNSNNVLQTGYNKDYHYDPRMADSPPPFFPTTGQYDLLSWQYR